jgi:hypothetical protein
VVSAADLAAETGPIEHYAHARAITGRAGLFPSRYQSDQVDHADGPLAHLRNARLRAACGHRPKVGRRGRQPDRAPGSILKQRVVP